MDTTLILLLAVVVGLGAVIFLQLRKKPEEQKQDDKSLLMLQQQINQIAQAVDNKLSESNKNVQEQFRHSADIIKNVTEQLTKLDATNKQVVGVTDQLKSLQDILKNPKQRGILGEYYLETVLKNVLPPNVYQMQYAFKDGTIVDAVVFVKDKIIPIDSKFSLENYNRMVEEKSEAERERLERAFKNDLKLRIDETSKYVKPDEGTMDFALMFIPHEAIYYDLLVNQVGSVKVNTQDLIEYAFAKHVTIVSPTTFLAQLQTILQGLRAMQIEEGAKEIKKNVVMLQKHLVAYEEYMKKMGGHLNTTVNAYNTAYKELGKIDKDVVRITDGELSVDIQKVEGPTIDA